MKKTIIPRIVFSLIPAVFFCLPPAYAQRAPIDINLIIDGSLSLTAVKDEILVWVDRRLDQILVEGDTVNVWNAGPAANIIYSGTVSGAAGREAVIRSIREISPSGNIADFPGALREAASRVSQRSPFSYTLVISVSSDSLSSALASPQANLLRVSRVEEFSRWRALIVGLNIDTRIRRAAAAFISAQ